MLPAVPAPAGREIVIGIRQQPAAATRPDAVFSGLVIMIKGIDGTMLTRGSKAGTDKVATRPTAGCARHRAVAETKESGRRRGGGAGPWAVNAALINAPGWNRQAGFIVNENQLVIMTVEKITEAENSLFEVAKVMASAGEHPDSDGPEVPPEMRI